MDIINNDIECDNNNDVISDSNDRRSRRMDEKSHRYGSVPWDQYVYTIAMFVNHFAYGVNYSLVGPTLVDLKYVFKTTMNMISIYLIFNNIGYLSGSLFGLLYKYINRQLTCVIVMTSMGISVAMVPFCPNLWTLYFCQYLNGLGAGLWDNANNVWLIEMWPKKSSAVLQFSQFMYGLGSVLGPILVKPYLTGENSTHIALNSRELLDSTGIQLDSDHRRSLLKTPFLVSGILQAFIPIVFLIMFFAKRYKNPDSLKMKDSTESLISDETTVDRSEQTYRTDSDTDDIDVVHNQRSRSLLIGLFALFVAIYSSLEIAHFGYSSTYYQFIPLHITAQNAAEILSVMSTSYTIGRCLSAFIALRIGPQIMIIYHLFILIVGMAVLYYGQHVLSLIWIGNIILGFGFSAMYSAIIALTAKHVKLTDTVSTVLVFANGTVSMFTPFILGPLIESYPFVFIELELVYLILSALLFLIILTVLERTSATVRPQRLLD